MLTFSDWATRRVSYAALINVNGTFYGTTESGGAYGNGTVFTMSPKGTEQVQYSFKGNVDGDGIDPYAGFINVNGTLYGTTESGGANDQVVDGTIRGVPVSCSFISLRP